MIRVFSAKRSRPWFALAAACLALPAFGAEVEGLRVWSGPQSTRVVLDLSGPAEHRLMTLEAPERIVVDLPATSLRRKLELPEPKGYVSNVRTGKRPDGALRVVLDLTRDAQPKTFLLEPDGRYGHRLVVDLFSGDGARAVRRTASSPGAQSRGRDLVVVIDAGHGGNDPGAVGPSGVREKTVVLDIAERLAARLEKEPGVRPVMTRTSDRYVSHTERIHVAHDAEADLFVSIHADAFDTPYAKGATVYTLSTERATDEVTRRVVERENSSGLKGGVSLADKDDTLARILLDLSQSAAMSASIVAGQRVIDAMQTVTSMRKPKPQQGSFIVLTSPDVPSLLIETAYLTNPTEERKLTTPAHQRRLAGALHSGIIEYFRTHAPADTYFANHLPERPAAPREHVISRGETLSEIAERYHISVSALKSSNSLRTDRIRIGQVLTIPPG